MFVSLIPVATVALLSLRSFVSASPLVARHRHGAYSPPITSPQEGVDWEVGSTQTVTWDASNIPPSAANDTGTLILGYLDGYSDNENLDTRHPLASGFSLYDGAVRVEVPYVEPRDTYIVVLMGNSGNASPTFSIFGFSSASGDSSSPSDEVIAEKDPNDLDPIDQSQRLADFEGPPTPPVCRRRHLSPYSGSTASQGRSSTSDRGPNKQC